jgi:hypothetical protein
MDEPRANSVAIAQAPERPGEPALAAVRGSGDFYDADAVTFLGGANDESAVLALEADEAELREQVELRVVAR